MKLKLVKLLNPSSLGVYIQIKPFPVHIKLGEVKEFSEHEGHVLIAKNPGMFEMIKETVVKKDKAVKKYKNKDIEGL